MTARPFEQQIPKRLHAKHIVSSRTISIALAVIADAGLVLLLFQRNGILSTADIEPFWVKQFIAFAIYSSLQLWTLAYQTFCCHAVLEAARGLRGLGGFLHCRFLRHRYHQSALADEAIEFGAAGGLKLLAQKGALDWRRHFARASLC